MEGGQRFPRQLFPGSNALSNPAPAHPAPRAFLPATRDPSQCRRNLLKEDLLAVRGRRDGLPLLAKDGQALGLREVTDGCDNCAEEEDGAEHEGGNDGKGHPDERGDEREETPDLRTRQPCKPSPRQVARASTRCCLRHAGALTATQEAAPAR